MESPTRSMSSTPNAHPYPIKTTSTGILTRSNSTSAHGSWARHKYSPALPSRNPDMHSSVHNPTRSEGGTSNSPSPSKSSRTWIGRTPAGELVKLPRHPYLWTPAHLGTYLSTALNGPDGDPLVPEVAQRIIQFIHAQKIGGRAFLSLDQEDFQEMDGIDGSCAEAVWDAVRTLRAAAAPYRPSRMPSAAYKRGRVRGIVGVFERSTSESSDAGEGDPSCLRFRSSNVSLFGYESTEDERLPDSGHSAVRKSAAPNPHSSHMSESPSADHDRLPHTREVEIVSFTDSNPNSEPSMAELYGKTYAVPAPSPIQRALDREEDVAAGKTVKIAEVPAPWECADVVGLPTPAPLSLAELFLPAPPSVSVPERHLLAPSPVIMDPPAPQSIYVLPPETDQPALLGLDALKVRLAVVEDRIAAMERKDRMNGDVLHDTEDRNIDHASETRHSAYILLAGAMAGMSVVLVPLLFRHFWTR